MEHHESLIRHLMDTVRCSVCSSTYPFDNVTVLGHQDELWFLSVTCPECRTQGLIAALVRGEDSAASVPATPTSAGVSLSDAPPSGPPINDTDVADMREFLRTFRGDFAAVVSQH